MSCSSSSSVSLLQLQRPTTKGDCLACRTTDGGVRRSHTDAAEGPCATGTELPPRLSITTTTHVCSEHRSCSSPTPSSSSGRHYLNVDPTCSMSTDLAESELISELPDLQSSCASLRSVAAGALGQALPRSRWQPDSDSSLCSFKLCSTIFGPPSYFTLGPRRHHCRLCGLLFCHDHSRTRALVSYLDKNGDTALTHARVCDDCVEKKSSDVALSRSLSMDTESSQPSEYLATPDDSGFYQTLPPRRSVDHDAEVNDAPQTPPVEAWMGRDAVLSLYPLAANTSRSSCKVSPSAAPLFAPSRLDRRTARDKEVERLTLRQRRLGKENSFLLPCYQGDDSDVEEPMSSEGVLVRDGPICYRTKAGRHPARIMSRTDITAIFD